MNQNGRPWYFWPIIAFVVGFLIGWLVIGWVVWPVTWTNALVQDLRADLHDQYVTMVAESYAQTGNLDQAQKRLEGWSTEQLTRIMSDAQKVLAVEDVDAARSVQSLAAALGASAGGTGAAPGQSQVPSAGCRSRFLPCDGISRDVWAVLRRGALCLSGISRPRPADFPVPALAPCPWRREHRGRRSLVRCFRNVHGACCRR